MKEIKLKEDLEKIYPLIKQLRNNLSLKDFLDKFPTCYTNSTL